MAVFTNLRGILQSWVVLDRWPHEGTGQSENVEKIDFKTT